MSTMTDQTAAVPVRKTIRVQASPERAFFVFTDDFDSWWPRTHHIGATLICVWQRLRTGDRRPLFAALVIGLLYIGIGAFGLVYRHGDPFMAFFVVLGSVLLLSGYVLARPDNPSES